MHFRFELYRQLSAQVLSMRGSKLTFTLHTLVFLSQTFRSRQLELTYDSNSGLGLSLYLLSSRTSRIRLSIAVLGFPCYFIDGRISIRRTYGVLRHSRMRRRQDFLISLLPNVVRVGDLYSTSSAG